MVGAIISGVSALLSGVQAINNFQKAKQAERSAVAFGNQLSSLKEQNPYAALQIPDMVSAQLDRNAQQTASATAALQGMGPEGAAQVANLNQAAIQQNADIQAQQNEAIMNKELYKANAQANINERETERKQKIIEGRLTGAQQTAAVNKQAGFDAIAGGIQGLGTLGSAIYGMENFDFGKGNGNGSIGSGLGSSQNALNP